jgi:peptide subunit release factor 1 (eRF1)
VNQTQKYILVVCDKNQALKMFLQSQRIQIVERAISFPTKKCEELDISIERRGRRRFRKRMSGEKARDAGVTLAQKSCKEQC